MFDLSDHMFLSHVEIFFHSCGNRQLFESRNSRQRTEDQYLQIRRNVLPVNLLQSLEPIERKNHVLYDRRFVRQWFHLARNFFCLFLFPLRRSCQRTAFVRVDLAVENSPDLIPDVILAPGLQNQFPPVGRKSDRHLMNRYLCSPVIFEVIHQQPSAVLLRNRQLCIETAETTGQTQSTEEHKSNRRSMESTLLT